MKNKNHSQRVGRLKSLDLLELWENESTDLTPWLAEPENLEQLGTALGLQLDPVKTETQVGPYRADLVCRDRQTGKIVLVENQLEQTDHTHLGQLLTYAAGLESFGIVWLARRFSEQHRAALDWLNRITDERFAFFGIELELLQIDTSLPAPRFNVVVKPNKWIREITAVQDNGYHAGFSTFWTGFVEHLKHVKPPFPLPTPAARNWIRVTLPLPDCSATTSISLQEGIAKVFLICNSEEVFKRFRRIRSQVEKELFEVHWAPSSSGGTLYVISEPFAVTETPEPAYHWITDRLRSIHSLAAQLNRK